MTTQLWAWEYEGDYWIGYKRDNGSLGGISKQGWQGIICSRVTNLRPAKVADADAVTISKEFWGWINSSDVAYEISSENPQLNTTPPVTEPTGFGAVVEAEAKHYEGERTRFVRATLGSQPNWFCDTIRQKVGDREQVIRYYWSDLINPVVISEGVRN